MLIFDGRLPSGAVPSHSPGSLLISRPLPSHHEITCEVGCHPSLGLLGESLQDRRVLFGLDSRLALGRQLLAQGVALCLQRR